MGRGRAPQQTQKQKDDEADRQTPSDKPYVVAAGEYSYWLEDVHYHSIDLQKLKIKAGSVEKAFEPVDLAFAPFGMLLMKLAKKAGLFSASKQSPDDVRDLVREHLSDEKPLDQLPVPFHQLIDAEEVKQLRLVQPAPSDYESMFAGVPIFGQGRIAVRFAKGESETTRTFASFTLSEFRIFVVILSDLFGMKDFAADCEIPLVNSFTELKCHYSGQPVKALDQLDYYKADAEFTLKVVGRKCAECGIVVSEEARERKARRRQRQRHRQSQVPQVREEVRRHIALRNREGPRHRLDRRRTRGNALRRTRGRVIACPIHSISNWNWACRSAGGFCRSLDATM